MRNKNYIPMNIVIFSKDRACQLDLFLTSMQTMFREHNDCNIKLLYTVSNILYKRAYLQLEKAHKKVEFIRESDFKNDLIAAIDSRKKYTVFFVDDIVWKEPFSVDCDTLKLMDKDHDILCLSLRLDPGLTYCYAHDTEMKAPQFDPELRWFWNGKEGDYGYPMSLDGHIFRTNDLLPLISKLPYFNPNTLEGSLSENPVNKGKMICMKKAPIFNIPINKVQNQNSNRHGNISAEYLNKMYLKGYRISLPPLVRFSNNACHQEVDITIRRPLLSKIKDMLNIYERSSK